MAKHTPQWRLDIKLMRAALIEAKNEILNPGYARANDVDILRLIDLAIAVGSDQPENSHG